MQILSSVPVAGSRYTDPVFKRVAGTDPAANAECSDAVPTNKAWLLLSWSVSLVQGATQTPGPSVYIDDGTNVIWRSFFATAALNASTTTQLTASVNATPVTNTVTAGDQTITISLPRGLYLAEGFRIRTTTTGKGANTDYGAPSLYVVEYTSKV